MKIAIPELSLVALVGASDPALGSPTQMAVFTRQDG